MNIRSVSNPAQVLAKDKIEASKAIKSDQTEDREANGQQLSGEGEAHRPLSEEEWDEVLEKIRENEGIKKHALIVSATEENDQKIIKIESPEGQVIRRFVERDLYFFLKEGQGNDIQLLKKTA